jgi:hypothetical protein
MADEKAIEKLKRSRTDAKILGVPAVRAIISYESSDDGLIQLKKLLTKKGEELKTKGALCRCSRDREFFRSLGAEG